MQGEGEGGRRIGGSRMVGAYRVRVFAYARIRFGGLG